MSVEQGHFASGGSAWSDGYFVESAYTFGYYRELSPTQQRYCLLLSGLEASWMHGKEEGEGGTSLPEDFTYAELGFGQGFSLNIHAAANPGQFLGTDFNPAHAHFANTLSRSAGLDIQVFDDSFEQLLARNDLPRLDMLCLHGIWTWVSDANKKYIVEFADKFLKPGGSLYISYNTYPGWSGAAPLRQLFTLADRFADKKSTVQGRVQNAMDFASSILSAGSRYQQQVPWVQDKLAEIARQPPQYIVNEYFNAHWDVMYFSEMADWLLPARLDFACSAVPGSCLPGVGITKEAQLVLDSIQNPLMREQARDYFVNQMFRKDIFCRGAQSISPEERTHKLLSLRYVQLLPTEKFTPKFAIGMGEMEMDKTPFLAILGILAENGRAPKTGFTIWQNIQSQIPGVEVGAVLAHLALLIHMGIVFPCQSVADEARVRARTQAFNLTLMRRAHDFAPTEFLASPLLGAAVPVDALTQIFLFTLSPAFAGQQSAVEHVYNQLQRHGRHILKDGAPILAREEEMEELAKRYAAFLADELPLYQTIGVL